MWNHALEALQHHGASLQQAIAVLGNQVGHQAVFLATMDIFTVAGVLTAALIGLVWLTSSARSQGGHAAASE